MQHRTLRWLAPALLALAFVVGLVGSASAAWNYESVKWRRQNNATGYNGGVYGIPPNGVGLLDTTYVSAAAARVDTTNAWNMLEAEPSPTGTISIGGATADSSQVGAVIVSGDSSVASTFAWGATTMQLQVNYGSNSTGWTSVGGTISPLATTTQKAIVFPIWNLPVATAHLGSTTFNASYNVFAPAVRAIITWGTAAAVPSARVYVRKWLGTGVINAPREQQQVNP